MTDPTRPDSSTDAGSTDGAAADDAVIIEVAVNGASSAGRNPHLPISPEEIAEVAVACIEAGAAIVHQHDADTATDPALTAEQSMHTYQLVLARRPDALLYPTATFVDPIQRRWGHHEPLARAGVIRIAYTDPGSVNLGPIGADGRRPPSEFVYVNSHADLAWKFGECERLGLGPSVAIFEPGFLRVIVAWHEAGRLPAGTFVKLYFGAGGPYSFGFPPSAIALDAYLSLLEGTGLNWAVAVLGGDVVGCGLAALAVERGGHLRVGLEDYGGRDQPSNVDLVRGAVAVIEAAGKRPATPTEAAAILGLPHPVTA